MSFDLKKFLTENRLTKNSHLSENLDNPEFGPKAFTSVRFPNGRTFAIGDNDPEDDGIVIAIEPKANGVLVVFGGTEGYGRYFDNTGNEISEDEYEQDAF